MFFSNPQHPYSQALLRDARQKKEERNSSTEEDVLLQVKDLKVHFPIKKGFFQRTVGYVKAVDGDKPKNCQRENTCALVGESGSGKSTIGKAILSLLDITRR